MRTDKDRYLLTAFANALDQSIECRIIRVRHSIGDEGSLEQFGIELNDGGTGFDLLGDLRARRKVLKSRTHGRHGSASNARNALRVRSF